MAMSRSGADASNSTHHQPRQEAALYLSSASTPRHAVPSEPHIITGTSSGCIIPDAQTTTPSSSVPGAPASPPSFEPESGHGSSNHGCSSPSCSQGDLADTEMEGGPSKPSTSEGAPEGAPRKKRTRTLTTPHQAAALHALLAQSQFPTTQMRELVGRSIGLSARRVQIWFQNQRQKARRPPATAPLTRQPRRGHFTNGPPGFESDIRPTSMTKHSQSSVNDFFQSGAGATSEMPYSGGGSTSCGPSELFAPAHHAVYLAEEYGPYGPLHTQLASPGMPNSSQRGLAHDPAWGRPWHGFPAPPSTSLSQLPEMYRATQRPGRPLSEQDPKLTLSFPSIVTRTPGPLSPLSAGGLDTTLASLSAVESSAPTHRRRSWRGAHRNLPPVNVDFSTPRPSLNIPPPFTLQPQPLWDDLAFSPYSRRMSWIEQRTAHNAPTSLGRSPTILHS